MPSNLHEDLSREDRIEGGSDRAFGLTVGGFVSLIVTWRLAFGGLGATEAVLGIIGGLLVGFALLAPAHLAPLNRLWTKLGLLLAKIVSPIVLGLIYALTIVPTGLIVRLLGRDLLRLRFEPGASSYWILREPPGPDPKSMPQQF